MQKATRNNGPAHISYNDRERNIIYKKFWRLQSNNQTNPEALDFRGRNWSTEEEYWNA